MKVANQLYCIVAFFAFVLIAIMTVNTIQVKKISDDWVERVRFDMIEKEKIALGIRTGDKANLSRLQFSKSIYNIDLMLYFSSIVSTTGFQFDYPLYYSVPPLDVAPGPLGTSTKDGRQHNALHSGWFKKGITNGPIKTAYEAQANVSELSNMDNVFYPLYKANSDYLNVYFGVESSGHYQTEPYTKTNFDVAKFIAYPSGVEVTGYDPRIRMWYYEAFNNNTKTILTPPYNDALTGKVLVTMARYINDVYPGEGVYGIDIFLDELAESITGSTILQNGQFYIASTNGDAVLYKNIDLDNVQKFVDVLLTNANEKAQFASVWQGIISNDKFNATFRKNGADWLLFSEKVIPDDIANNGGLLIDIDVSNVDIPYIIISAVPVSDIEKASNDIKESAEKNNNTILGIMIAILIVFIIVAVVLFYKLAKRFTKPLQIMENLANQLCQNNLEANLDQFNGEIFETSAEINSISNAMQNMYKFLRASNLSYYNGDMNAALASYEDVEKIVGGMSGDKTRIMGSINNNKGAAYHQLGDFDKAYGCYKASIDTATKLHQEAVNNKDDEMAKKHQGVILNRKYNMAVLGVDALKAPGSTISKDGVKHDIDEVLNMARTTENLMVEIDVRGLLGKYFSAIGDNANAYAAYNGALNDLRQMEEHGVDKVTENPFCVEHAIYNMAEFYYNEAESTGDANYAVSSMQLIDELNQRNNGKQNIPFTFIINIFQLQLAVAEKLGRQDIVDGVQGVINNNDKLKGVITGSGSGGPQFFDFNIDISGSMSVVDDGSDMSRISAVASSLQSVNAHVIKDCDNVCITTFNSHIKKLTDGEYVPKQQISHIMNRPGSQWGCGSTTAFFRTFSDSMDRIYNKQYTAQDAYGRRSLNPTCQPINVFVLTDGSDYDTNNRTGHSKDWFIKNIDRRIKECRVNLIIFTIGNEYDKNAIAGFIESAKSTLTSGGFGEHLQAGTSADAIKDKFNDVKKLMAGANLKIEALA